MTEEGEEAYQCSAACQRRPAGGGPAQGSELMEGEENKQIKNE